MVYDGKFRFWCQKVLPLVYDDSLSYYELLCKVVKRLNETTDGIAEVADALKELKDYVDHYFDSADFEAQINARLDEMVEDGTFADLINQQVLDNVASSQTFFDGSRIAIFGDSSLSEWRDFPGSDWLGTFMPNCTVQNMAISGARWAQMDNDHDLWTQVNAYNPVESANPDIVLLLSASNDITAAIAGAEASPSTLRIGDFLGAPDANVKTTSTTRETQSFPAIKATLNLIRNKWPTARIYCLTRADHPQILGIYWQYFKYFEVEIMKSWGVPVIDLNSILNYSYFIDAQTEWATKSDNLHYSAEMNKRIQKHLAGILNSGNPSTMDVEPPSAFFVPALGTDIGNQGVNYAGACVRANWCLNHCANHFQKAVGLNGTAHIAQNTYIRFFGSGTAQNNRGLLIMPDLTTYVFDGSASDDLVINNIVKLEKEWQLLTSGTINGLTTPGNYYFSTASGITGVPSDASFTGWWYLTVYADTGTDHHNQMLIGSSLANRIYIRRMSPGGSNNWNRFNADTTGITPTS